MNKKIPKYWLIIVVLSGILTGVAFAQTAQTLAISPTVHITVLPPSYNLTLYVNGTNSTTDTDVIHAGDTLNLTAVAISSPPSASLGKTVNFYSNNALLGTGPIVLISGVYEVQASWIVPSLTSPPQNDYYALNATLV